MFIDPKVIESINPSLTYEDFVDWADLDVVTCLTMVEEPDTIQWVNRETGLWQDKWGCMQHLTEEMLSVPAEPPRITSMEDLETYIPPDPFTNPVIKKAEALVKRFHGKKAVCVVGEAVFAVSQYLRGGLPNLMMDYILNPDLAKRLAKIGMEYHIELYRKLIGSGVEIVALGDDYAGKTGTLMSPAHFDEFILPGLGAVVREIKNAGGYVIKHTDGNIWGIMDSLISTGLDMLGPLEPPYMMLEKVRTYLNGAVGVTGNINVDLLIRGSIEAVTDATKSLLAEVSPLGGHLFGSGNSISSAVKGENFMAMIETVRRYGIYPIDTAALKN